MPVSIRLVYTAILFCTRNAVKKNLVTKIRACRLSTAWPTILWCLGSNVLQVHNRQTKVTFCFTWIYSSESMQAFNMPVKFMRTFITFNTSLFSQEIWRSYVKLSPLQAIQIWNKNINFWLSYWEFARGLCFWRTLYIARCISFNSGLILKHSYFDWCWCIRI